MGRNYCAWPVGGQSHGLKTLFFSLILSLAQSPRALMCLEFEYSKPKKAFGTKRYYN